MKNTVLTALVFVSSSASASVMTTENCKLKVYTTSPYASVVVHFMKFQDYTVDQCQNLCSSKALLQAQVPQYEMILRCGMKFTNEDGSITKASYNHLFQR
jgi:hypothetical protein